MRTVFFTVFALGLVILGTLGASNVPALYWLGYLVMAVASLGVLLLFGGRGKAVPSVVCLLSVLCFVGYVVWRAAESPVAYLARPDLVSALVCLIVFTLAGAVFEGRGWRWWIVVIVLVTGAAQLGAGGYQYMVDPTAHPLGFLGLVRDTAERTAGGFFRSENHFAWYVEAVAFLSLAFAVFGRVRVGTRLVLFFYFAMSGVGLAISTSRGAMLASAVALVFFVVVALGIYLVARGRFGVRVGMIAAVPALLLMLTLGWVVNSVGKDHYKGKIFGAAPELRVDMARMAIRQFEIQPIIGTGARTYSFYSRRFKPNTLSWIGYHDIDAEYAHNDYLQLLADYGIAGVVLALIVLIVHYLNGLRYLRWFLAERYSVSLELSSQRLALCVGSLTVLTAFVAHSVVDFNLHLGTNAVLAALVLGFLAAPGFRRVPQPKRSVPLSSRWGLRLVAVACLAAGGGVVWIGIPAVRAEWALERADRLRNEGRLLEATRLYNIAIGLDPRNYRAALGKGLAFDLLASDEDMAVLSRGWRIKAVEAYDSAAASYPQNVYALMCLADSLSQVEAFEDAERVYQQAFEWSPNFRRLVEHYGVHLVRSGRLVEAKQAFEKALAMNWVGDRARDARQWIRLIDAQLAREKAANPGPKPTPAPAPKPDA